MYEDISELEYPINVIDNDGNVSVDRTSLVTSIIDHLSDYLESSKVYVGEVSSNFVELTKDDETITFNISDELELEMKLIVASVISDENYVMPSINLHLASDEMESLIVVGFDLLDNGSLILSESSGVDYDYSVNLSTRYLTNRLQMGGVLSYSKGSSGYARYLELVKNNNVLGINYKDEESLYANTEDDVSTFLVENFYSDSTRSLGTFDPDLVDKNESANPSAGQVAKERKEKKLARKRILMERKKDPAAYRKRSMAAKLRWRKNRAKMIKGMKKFHNSAQGKRINKIKGKKLSIGSTLD